MFLRFTRRFSRPAGGFIIALLMLFAPAFIVTTVESAPQKNKPKATPTPKKKAAPDKKTQAKTKPTPKPTPSKSKTNSKNSKETASKDKNAKKNEKSAPSKNNQKSSDRSKNSKTTDKKNTKQNLAKNNKVSSKNDRNSKTSERGKTTSSKNTDKKQTTRKTTKPTVAKTETRQKPKTINTKSEKTDTTKTVTPEVTTETSVKNTALSEIIVSTYSVPVRSQASATAPLMSNVKLGTILRVAEKKTDWYKVQYLADGRTETGWIPASAVNDLKASGRSEIYRQIVEQNYKPQMDFETASEFYQFTTKVGNDLDGSEKSAEIELKRLLALRWALKNIPADRRETAPYKDFLTAQEKEIVYNEPVGNWLVVSNEFWDLHGKYKKLPVAETIAWEAANNPLPGECQGYVNCYLFDMRMRFGEYLSLHPNGAHAAEALKNMTDYLSPIAADAQQKTVYNGPTDVTDRAEFNNLIAELRTIVARLQFVEKEKTLQQLKTIAEAYR